MKEKGDTLDSSASIASFSRSDTPPYYYSYLHNSFYLPKNISGHGQCTMSQKLRIGFKFLPAYSSFLNPIESAFSCWKAAVKRGIALRHMQQNVNEIQVIVVSSLF